MAKGKSKRPRIRPEKQPIDRILEVLAVSGLLFMIVLLASNYASLPESVPSHFDLKGRPDSYGSRALLWVLAAIAVALWGMLVATMRYPHTFNYPVEITEENALEQYTAGVRLLLVMNVISSWMFAGIAYAIIRTANGAGSGLGTFTVAVWSVGLAVIIAGYFYYARKSERQRKQAPPGRH